MSEEQKEAIIWLMMEYATAHDKLNGFGLGVLMDLRDKWDIDKAKKILLKPKKISKSEIARRCRALNESRKARLNKKEENNE